MHNHLVLRIVSKLFIPFILVYGFYVLLHGKYSPGGGFQAGVILASAFIIYGLIFGASHAQKLVPEKLMRMLAALGALIFVSVGFVTLFQGGQFLEYNVLSKEATAGQFWGIMLVEAGIGLTVTSVMIALFYTFVQYEPEEGGAP